MKYEGQHARMVFRRLLRPFSFILALWCLWRISISDLKEFIADNEGNFVSNINEFAAHHVPDLGGIQAKPRSRIAKVTVAVNSLNRSVIHQAMQTHKVQNEMHGYFHHIVTTELLDDISEVDRQQRPRGAWSKPAYILSILVAELAKPENERLQWLFWFDADTVIINPHTPLEIFLPPDESMPELSNVNLLMSANWDGLNSGAFAIRVCPWSVSLMSLVLAYPVYEVQRLKKDRFRDQSAFQWLLQSKQSPLANSDKGFVNRNHWDHWVEIPMRWFNSLPINNAFSKKQDWIFNHNMTHEYFDNGTNVVFKDGWGPAVKPWKVMQGDMAVHFAGATPVRDSWMGPWLQRAEARLPEWSNATKQVELQVEATNYWHTKSTGMVYDRAKLVEREKEKQEQERRQRGRDKARKERERLDKESLEKAKIEKVLHDKGDHEKGGPETERHEGQATTSAHASILEPTKVDAVEMPSASASVSEITEAVGVKVVDSAPGPP